MVMIQGGEAVEFEFKCSGCGAVHRGMPAFVADEPVSYLAIAPAQRASRCEAGADFRVIDGEDFFVAGCIEIPVHGHDEPFSWGVWVSLSAASFAQWKAAYPLEERAHIGPFFGWLNAWLKPYPQTLNLKTRVHLRDHGIRPYIELEPTDHPLAVEQRTGISVERVAEIYVQMMHAEGGQSE